jgi:two-component system, chemotaxis family, response regulator WspF
VKIAIVNDLPMAVSAIQRVLALAPQHQVIWVAADGIQAVERCQLTPPDLVLMDLIMPRMNGVEAIRQIMARTPCSILVVTTSVDENAALVFEALGAGALDAVNTPQWGLELPQGIPALLAKVDLIQKLTMTPACPATPAAGHARGAPGPTQCPMVAIGASAGGPAALAKICQGLAPGFPGSLVVVQHLDAAFMPGLISWLASQTQLPVRVAESDGLPEPGAIHVAGHASHLVLNAKGRFAYVQEPLHGFYKPSVDVFFESVVRHWAGKVIGVLLTGMGRDGARGLKALRQSGATTLVQDQKTCAVFGMPKAALELEAATAEIPLDEIAGRLSHLLTGKSPIRR